MLLERSTGTWMSLIYRLSYAQRYSPILRVILPLKNILYHKIVTIPLQYKLSF